MFDINYWGVVYGLFVVVDYFWCKSDFYGGVIINMGSEVFDVLVLL